MTTGKQRHIHRALSTSYLGGAAGLGRNGSRAIQSAVKTLEQWMLMNVNGC